MTSQPAPTTGKPEAPSTLQQWFPAGNDIEGSLDLIGSTDVILGPWRQDAAAAMVIPYRRWEDFLVLGTTEVREYGQHSIQVMRRMRAMLATDFPTTCFQNAALRCIMNSSDSTPPSLRASRARSTRTGPGSPTDRESAARGARDQPV